MQESIAASLVPSSHLPKGMLMVSPDIGAVLNITPGQCMRLKVGTRSIEVVFAGSYPSVPKSTLLVDESTARQIMLPLPTGINLTVRDPGAIRIGPLIGIFARRSPKPLRPFGEQTSFFRRLASAADRQQGFCFAFGPDDIDWEHEVINGSIPPRAEDQTADWRTLALPFPDVVYDRGLFNKGEERRGASAARKRLRGHPHIQVFNPAFFGKWKTHNLLGTHPTLAQSLPVTEVLTFPDQLDVFLDRFGGAFLKPSGGSSGRGIIRISSGPEGFVLKTHSAGKPVIRRLPDRSLLKAAVQERLAPQKYIIQQPLSLARFRGNPFDVRVLMQKNRAGVWLRTGMATRVAGPGSEITNIHAGGTAQKISLVLGDAFPSEQVRFILNNIRKLCALSVAVVSTEASPIFGEIAIDLGVDETGRVWLIELNAIPGRTVFRRLGMTETAQRAVSRPMEYACYLAGFGAQKDETYNKEENL